MIKTIAIRGMKNHEEYSVDLSQGKLLLIGPNGSGKSAVLDAVRFAILGYIPALGKRPSDTSIIMSGSEMTVTLTLDDDRSIRRTLKRTGKKLIGTVEASWLRNAKPAEHHDEVLSLFGSCELDIVEILDIRTLLHETPVKRSARIEEMIGGSGLDSKDLIERVGEQTVRRLYDGETDAEWRDLLKSLPEHQRYELKDLQGYLQSVLKEEDGIRGGVDWARKEKNSAHQRISDGEKAAREIETRLESMPESDGNLADLRDERDRLQRDYGEEREKISTARKRSEDANALDKTIEEMRGLTLEGGSIEGAEDELKDLKKKYDALIRPKYSDEAGRLANAAEQAEREYMDGKKASETRHRENERQEREMKAEIDQLQLRLKAARSDDWQTVYDLAGSAIEISNNDSITVDAIRKIAERNIGKPKVDIEHELEDAQAQLHAFEGPLPDNTAIVENTRLILEEAKAKHEELKDVHRELLANYNGEETRMAHRMTELQVRLDEVSYIRECLAKARINREALGEIPEITDKRASIQDSIDEISVKIDEVDKHAAVKSELKAILEDVEKRRARWTCLSAILWAMERVREDIISDAGDPLTKAIDSFLKSSWHDQKSHLNAEKGKCESGWTDGNRTVLVEAMSGGEWQVFTTAFAVAMITLRAPEVPILLAEIGECDIESCYQLIQGLVMVQATVIAATHIDDFDPGDSYADMTIEHTRVANAV